MANKLGSVIGSGFAIKRAPSAVNFMQITGKGSDTNVAMGMGAPKGTGKIAFSTNADEFNEDVILRANDRMQAFLPEDKWGIHTELREELDGWSLRVRFYDHRVSKAKYISMKFPTLKAVNAWPSDLERAKLLVLLG